MMPRASAFDPISGSGVVNVTLAGGSTPAQGILTSGVTLIKYVGGSSTFAETLTLGGGTTIGPNTLSAYTGTSSLVGGSGSDSLTGGSGADTLTGGAGSNTLTGGAGTDTILETASSSDTTFTLTNTTLSLSGGQGSDTYSGVEILKPTGGSGNDNFIISSFASVSTSAVLNGGGGTNTVTAVNDTNFSISSTTLNRAISGGSVTFTAGTIQQASLTGGASNNTFTISGFTRRA